MLARFPLLVSWITLLRKSQTQLNPVHASVLLPAAPSAATKEATMSSNNPIVQASYMSVYQKEGNGRGSLETDNNAVVDKEFNFGDKLRWFNQDKVTLLKGFEC